MPRKILIIDDDRGDQKLIQKAINNADLDVEIDIAGNSEEAIKKTDNLKPNDVVVLDTVLPGVDGFQICKKIKAINENLKVIICTGVVDAVDAARARAAGADDYCVKTADYEPLIEAVKLLI